MLKSVKQFGEILDRPDYPVIAGVLVSNKKKRRPQAALTLLLKSVKQFGEILDRPDYPVIAGVLVGNKKAPPEGSAYFVA